MAIFDTGVFSPAESAYGDSPAAYRESLRAESVKHASYLSSMDQFYAELDEMQRQFDATLGYKQDVLGFEREKFDETLAWDKEKAGTEFELQERALDIQSRAVRGQEQSDTQKRIDLRESSFLRDYWGGKQQPKEAPLNFTGSGVTRTEAPAETPAPAGSLELTRPNVGSNAYDPFRGQSISKFLGL
jgi:hypothetical protein